MRYDGRMVIVTGASGGLGRALALRFATEGATVGVHFHASEAKAAETLDLIQKAGGRGSLVQADGRSQVAVGAAVADFVATWGRLDVIVNNAGQHRIARSLEQSQDEWDDLIGRNLSATFLFAQSAARHMKESGGGQIVNISSKMATSTAPSNAAYCAAKAGIIALTQVLAAEWARYNIRVNCVAPGVLATAATATMTGSLDDDGLLQRALLARTPVGRLGELDEIASVVAFIASGESNYLTGSTLVVDGGWTSYSDYSGWGFARRLLAGHQAGDKGKGDS